jgi:hypothetical protein
MSEHLPSRAWELGLLWSKVNWNRVVQDMENMSTSHAANGTKGFWSFVQCHGKCHGKCRSYAMNPRSWHLPAVWCRWLHFSIVQSWTCLSWSFISVSSHRLSWRAGFHAAIARACASDTHANERAFFWWPPLQSVLSSRRTSTFYTLNLTALSIVLNVAVVSNLWRIDNPDPIEMKI